MEKAFDLCRKNRIVIKNILENTPKEKLFEIPDNFNNNIWWNIAHIIATQQLLVYRKSNTPEIIAAEFIKTYSKGTKPDHIPTQEEIDLVSSSLLAEVDQMEADYKAGVFSSYEVYTTSIDVCLDSIEAAIGYNNYHEGIHLGSILALRRVLQLV